MCLIAAQAARGEVSGAREHFDHFGRNGAGMLAVEIIGSLRDNNQSLDQRLQLAEVGLALLDHQRDKEGVDLSWAVALRQALANRQYSSGSGPSLRPLYEFPESDDSDDSDEGKKRRDLHDKLCRKMIQVDELAADGFAGLLASHEATGEVDDRFVELASEAVRRPSETSAAAVNQYLNQVPRSTNYSGQAPRRSPGEHLVRHAWQTGDWSAIDEQVLPNLRKQGRSDLVQKIEDYRNLYECEAADFFDAAREYVRGGNSAATARLFQPGPVTKACEVLRARKLDVDVDPLLIDFMRDYVRAGQMSYAPAL